jgi:hypothetical protein
MKLALMTSFSTFGVFDDETRASLEACDGTYRALRSGISASHTNHVPAKLPVEIYLAMERDLRHLARVVGKESVASGGMRPATVLTTLNQRLTEAEVVGVADALHRAIGGDEGREIVALASFLPELASSDLVGPPTRQPAQVALANIIRVGGALRRRHGHPVHVVEAVCGSLVERLTPPAEGDDLGDAPRWKVTLDDRDKVFDRLLESLHLIWRELGPLEAQAGPLPPIALELEPGLCFALRGPRSLTALTEKLAEPVNRPLQARVGYNLDLSHFAIAGVSAVEVRANREICDRILHVHASGFHPQAHFGDCSPSEDNLRKLDPWFEFLRELDSEAMRSRRPNGWPQFPVVSVSNMKRLENSGRSRSRCCSLEPVCGVGVGHDPRGDFKPAAHQSPSARGGVNVGGRCQCARQPSRFSRDGGSGFRGPIIDGDQLQASGGQRSRRGLFNLLIEWKLHQILGSQQHPFEVHLSILWILQQTTTFNQDRR